MFVKSLSHRCCHTAVADLVLAEYIRVPFADNSCVLIPPGKEKENDYVMISDIFCTA